MHGVILGIDVGSVSLKVVVLGPGGEVRFEDWRRTEGKPVVTARLVLDRALAALGDAPIRAARVTGSGQRLLAGALGLPRMNEIMAHAVAAWTLHPEVRSVIEIGGQDSKFVRVGRESAGRPFVADHAFNDLCAAGTGAFLDQMAGRLGVSVEDLGRMAARAPRPAGMAGRCAVFAKTDLIHLQQRACPPDEIAAGLCFALVRNYLASVCHGRPPEPPILFQGGVAANEGVVRALREVLGLRDGDLTRPERFKVMGALGAALSARDDPLPDPVPLSDLRRRMDSVEETPEDGPRLDPLPTPPPIADGDGAPCSCVNDHLNMIYIGLDVGSVSTKAVALDEGGRLVASSYLPTVGKPVGAVRRALEEIRSRLPEGATIAAAVTTGSGRHVALQVTDADEAVDEITAQARYAAHADPEADTVFEIGGQDSKYIRLERGRVTRFQMNRACAAGTGAFLEEQAARLGLDIATDFAGEALRSHSPARLGNRCTVFMDSDLVHHAQRGRPVADLCAGLAYAVARNYLDKVVGSRPVGRRVLFQGGVARNAAVHAAFQALLDREVVVPSHPELSGALGAALIARERTARRERPLLGLQAPMGRVDIRTFECRACENLCEVQRVTVVASEPRRSWFGSVCGRWERGEERPLPASDAMAIRERLLTREWGGVPASGRDRGEVAFPLALTLHDHLPFWRTFFQALGFRVRPSGPTDREVTALGLARVPAEFCQPVKALFGHVHSLVAAGAKRVFIPHLRLFAAPGEAREWYACPYTQAAPYVVRAHLHGAEVLALELPVRGEEGHFIRAVAATLGAEPEEVGRALRAARKAQADFRAACRGEGRRVLDDLGRSGRVGAVLLGRPYNTADRHLNLNLARRLRAAGLEPLPLDFLPLEDERLPDYWRRVRWGQGRTLLKAARIVRRDPRLVGVVVTNFGCGPDAFVDQYLEEILAETPHIVLEFDDHQAEAGLVTRVEAFARTVRHAARGPRPSRPFHDDVAIAPGTATRPLREYTYWVPCFADHAHALVGALRWAGCRVRLLPPTDAESYEIGLRHAYGRECHPYVAFLGDLLRAARRPDFVPDEACFYGPSYLGPCLLPQYMVAMNQVLRRVGLERVTLLNIADPPTMAELGRGYIARLVLGLLAIDRLHKWKVETEGYEAEAGEAARVHAENLQAIEDGLAEGRFFRALRESVERFRAVRLRPDAGTRPKVGMAGDIYTRVNPHANDRLYDRLREAGFEVWTSCMLIDVSWLGAEQWSEELARRDRPFASLATRTLWPLIRAVRGLVNRHFPPSIRTPEEGHFPEVRAGAERYCSYWIDRLLSLNLHRFREMHRAGAAGVLNVMCHHCMLGTITQALIPAMRRDLPGLEIATLTYDGLQSTHTENRLQAFLAQVASRAGPIR